MTHDMPQRKALRQLKLAWLVLGIGLLLTLYLADRVRKAAEEDAVAHFSFAADQVTIKLEERLATYAMALRGAAGMFNASDDVTRAEWQVYTEKLRVSDTVVGVQGIGFSMLIPSESLEQHLAEVRAQGFPDYAVRPAGQREIYSSIVYLEPFDARNRRAFGYDMFSEPVRRAAMIQARDTGLAALTGKVELVQETDVDVQAGTLMYVPVYRQDMPAETVEQRRAALMGWAYSPYRMNDLMEGVLGGWELIEGEAVGLRIYDGTHASPASLLFSNYDTGSDHRPSPFAQERLIDFNGRQWLLVFDHLRAGVAVQYTSAWSTLAGGMTLSALLFGLILSMSNTRARALGIADQLTETLKQREAELRESEFRWRFAIEGSGDGLWDWNLQDGSVFVSTRLKEMLGYAEDELEGSVEEWERRIHPEDKAETLAAWRACLDGRTASYANEHRLLCKDGGWKWILDRGVVVSRDKSGQPLRMLGTHTDISARKALERSREQLLARLQTIASRVPGMVYEYRLYPDGRSCFPYSSEAIRQIYRVSPEEVSEDATAVLDILHPEDKAEVLASIQESARTLKPWRCDYRVRFADGSEHWLQGDALPHAEGDGAVTWYGFITDITERKQSELLLNRALTEARRFREAMDYLSSFVYMKDTASRYTYANRASLELFGCTAEDLPGSSDSRFFPPTTVHKLRQVDARALAGEQTAEEIEVVDGDGRRRVYLEIKTPIYDEMDQKTIVGLLGISTDITPMKEHEQQLEYIAHYDALTNLPNRVLLADRLQQAMAQAQRRGQHLAVVYLDLDGFKVINDRHGHASGDKVLMVVAGQMKSVLRAGDTLSRLGGDEFVAVLPDLSDIEATAPMLQRLLEAASRPVMIDGLQLGVTASLGVTYYPQGEPIEADQLLRQADQAMYQAKLAGKGRYHIFDAELDRSVRSHHESVDRIRSGLRDGEFVLHYQPKVNMRTGVVIGAESLIRWQHPERGLLPPGSFLPVIEDDPLAVEVGEWVIATALEQMTRWRRDGLMMPLSVNIGARQLREGRFVERLRGLLDRYPEIDPASLELEVLETSALGELEQVSRLLEECRAIGVAVSLDDFGIGYSSLTYLKQLPAGIVKVDRSFVSDILDDPDDLAILDGVMGLAGAFGRQVIAEGVESIAHADMLLYIGCELAQGYGIARPMPADELPAWVAGWKPEAHWPRLRPLSRERMPLLYAGVEHRGWVQQLASALTADIPHRPPLDIHTCRFGDWLDQSGLRARPEYARVVDLHGEVHALAVELCALKDEGRRSEVADRLDELYALRDRLLGALAERLD